MIKNKAILNEMSYREGQSFEENYEEIYHYLAENIDDAIYDFGYQDYLHYILRRFDIIPATEIFPSTLEIAFILYIEKNSENDHVDNLRDPDFKGFLTELENFDEVFYEVIYDHNKMYRTVGPGEYEFVIFLDQAESTEEMAEFIKEKFAGYAYEMLHVQDNLAVIHVEVDGEDTLFADVEILLYYALQDGELGTYTYEYRG